MNANAQPGKAYLKAFFRLDENRRLFVDVIDNKTGEYHLQDTLLANLETEETSEIATHANGFEPAIIFERQQRGGMRLSIRQLANLLSANALPPEAYSIESAAVMLSHKDLYVRYEAARMLGRRGDRAARLVLEDAVIKGDAPMRASAIRHVHGLTWFSAQPLVQAALADKEWRVRESTIYALCDFDDSRAYQLAADALQKETRDEVFAAAAWGLRNSFAPEAVPALKASLKAKNLEIHERALESLGTNGSPGATVVIQQVLDNDVRPEIQYAAALSLLEIKGDSCLPDLIANIKEGSPQVQLALLRAIFHASNYLGIQLGSSQFCEDLLRVLETTLDSDDPEMRLAAIWPLAWMRHPKADELLHRAYQHEKNRSLRAEIQHIAMSLGSPVAQSFTEGEK
jgi:HEAT repeat protein